MGCGGSKTEAEELDPHKKNNHEIMSMGFELHERTVDQYLLLQKEINAFERRHIPETYQVRMGQMEQLKRNLQKMDINYAEIQQQLLKQTPLKDKQNNQVVDRSVRNFLMGQDKYDDLTAFETADHVAVLNRNEIVRKEIDGTKCHIIQLQQEIDVLEEDLKDMKELYGCEDQLLSTVFAGAYGSDKENYLEDQLDSCQLKLQSIESANFTWRQAQVMVEYACKQIGTAVEKWEEIIKTPFNNLEARFKLAEETRNNLIAAGQNIQGAQRYLPHIKFPYCTPEEVEMLNKATSYVFTDMQAKARQTHALDVYSAAHKRIAALVQWFNEIINKTIKHDLDDMKEKTKATTVELRKERIQLMTTLIKEKFNKDVNVEALGIDVDNESEKEYELDGHEADRNASGRSMALKGSYSDLSYSNLPNAPSPIPIEELAPPPRREELFGKIDEITKQHRQNIHKMNNALKLNKARVNHSLHGKLEERQQRRTRVRNHSLQLEELSNGHMNGKNHPRLPHQADDRLEDIDGEEIVGRVMHNNRERY